MDTIKYRNCVSDTYLSDLERLIEAKHSTRNEKVFHVRNLLLKSGMHKQIPFVPDSTMHDGDVGIHGTQGELTIHVERHHRRALRGGDGHET